MRAVAIYHPNSDHSRGVEGYAEEFKNRGKGQIELASLESREGADIARLYDVVAYPSLLVIQDNGQLLKSWQGLPFPLMDEAAGYLNS